MPSRPLRNSPSVPYLRMKVPQRQLLFVHLAPIPKVPLAAPSITNHNEVDTLLALIDLMLWGTRDSPFPTKTSRLARVREIAIEKDVNPLLLIYRDFITYLIIYNQSVMIKKINEN